MNAEEKKAWEEFVVALSTIKCDTQETRYWLEDEILRAIDPKIILAADAALTRLSALEERCGDAKELTDQFGIDGRALSRWLLGKEAPPQE